MRIGLFHGFELVGSGSNEYTRYLAAALAADGHEVHVLCREPDPAQLAPVVGAAVAWDVDGTPTILFGIPGQPGTVTLHQLPHADIRPVYVTDKQRPGNVKAFPELTDEELLAVRELAASAVEAVLRDYPVDVLHANHTVLQPTIAADVCGDLGIPFVVYPHGSDIEYTIRRDERYRDLAGEALREAAGLITGSVEMFSRIEALYPDLAADLRGRWAVVGVGVDTSQFSPVPFAERRQSIEAFVRTEPGGGKPPELAAELVARLAAGDLEVITEQQHAYARELPDDDVASRLAALPWEDGKFVIFVGALTVGKGVQSVLAAWPEVIRQVPEAHLIIVGSGAYREVLEAFVRAIDAGDTGLIEHLVAHGNDYDITHTSGPWTDVAAYLADPRHRATFDAARGRMADHVVFTGRLDHDRLSKVFPCADLAVFPSVLPEAYPLVLMESLASGVLPCASDLTGLGEGLRDLEPLLGADIDVDRLRLPMADDIRVAAIADSLVSLLRDPAVPRLRPRLREIAVTFYDWRVRAGQMVRAYTELAT
ncbi:MAG: glycosyltransferase family 4 protein [Actinobacteria bacterium]|nr:glycosyltransferase family 4 protein [Actinomycetota bacterium]